MVMSPVHRVWPKHSCKFTVKGGSRQGRQRKRWEDNIGEWTRPWVCQVPAGSGEQGKMEEIGCEVICGAPTTLAVEGWMKVVKMKEFHIPSTAQASPPHPTPPPTRGSPQDRSNTVSIHPFKLLRYGEKDRHPSHKLAHSSGRDKSKYTQLL